MKNYFLLIFLWIMMFFFVPTGDVFAILNNPTSYPEDKLINSIEFSVTGIPTGAVFDICLYFERLTDPLLPAVVAVNSEVWCSHASRTGSGADWNGTVDLSATPLYLPKNTNYECAFGLFSVPDPSKVIKTCTVNVIPYQSGMPRYRSVRLPFVDSISRADGTLYPTYYWSTDNFPINVGGFSFFQSFYGSDADGSTTNICLRWLKEGGALVQKICAPNQTISPNINYTNPLTIYPVGWNIQIADILNATCDNSRPNSDCAIWAYIRIPDTFSAIPDTIIGNYGLVKQSHLNTYCADNLSNLWHYFFCDGIPNSECTDAIRINTCQTKLLYINTPTTIKPGDFNGDGKVDFMDLQSFLPYFSQSNATYNLTGTSIIDIFDVNKLLGYMFK